MHGFLVHLVGVVAGLGGLPEQLLHLGQRVPPGGLVLRLQLGHSLEGKVKVLLLTTAAACLLGYCSCC